MTLIYILFLDIEGRVGFAADNVTVTEGTDNVAIVTITFFEPSSISTESFVEFQVTTSDGTAVGELHISVCVY